MTPALPQPAVGAPAQKPATLPPRVTGMAPAVTQPPAAAKPSTPPAASKPPPSRAPAPVAAEGGLSEQKIKAIYDAYVMAKKRCGEDTSKLSLTSVADTLKKQVPALMKQHAAKSVEFKVVIKDGKAVLRALPKE
ncbi:MAG: hypothetical protein JNG84_04040, partial [Archangium sp.]|nr:hypothetical protein [Archangium sp.]